MLNRENGCGGHPSAMSLKGRFVEKKEKGGTLTGGGEVPIGSFHVFSWRLYHLQQLPTQRIKDKPSAKRRKRQGEEERIPENV